MPHGPPSPVAVDDPGVDHLWRYLGDEVDGPPQFDLLAPVHVPGVADVLGGPLLPGVGGGAVGGLGEREQKNREQIAGCSAFFFWEQGE